MAGNHKTDGGSKKHAVHRLQNQYGCKLSKKEIKRILRESNDGDIKNGRFILTKEMIRRLRISILGDLVCVVNNGVITTIIDN